MLHPTVLEGSYQAGTHDFGSQMYFCLAVTLGRVLNFPQSQNIAQLSQAVVCLPLLWLAFLGAQVAVS